jgi:hypothetical protein
VRGVGGWGSRKKEGGRSLFFSPSHPSLIHLTSYHSPPLLFHSYHNFLTPDETAHLIALAKPYMAKSRVVDNVSGEEKPSK